MATEDQFNYLMMGRRIRAARVAKHLTQKELAQGMGISTSFLGHIERGSRKASMWTLYCLCEVLHLPADHLMGLPDIEPPGLDVKTIVRRLMRSTYKEALAIVEENSDPGRETSQLEEFVINFMPQKEKHKT